MRRRTVPGGHPGTRVSVQVRNLHFLGPSSSLRGGGGLEPESSQPRLNHTPPGKAPEHACLLRGPGWGSAKAQAQPTRSGVRDCARCPGGPLIRCPSKSAGRSRRKEASLLVLKLAFPRASDPGELFWTEAYPAPPGGNAHSCPWGALEKMLKVRPPRSLPLTCSHG